MMIVGVPSRGENIGVGGQRQVLTDQLASARLRPWVTAATHHHSVRG